MAPGSQKIYNQKNFLGMADGLESQLSLRKTTILTATLLILVSLSSAAYSNELEWQQPFNPDSTPMPAHFDNNNGELEFIIQDQRDSITFVDYTLQRKTADQKSWSTLHNTDSQVQSHGSVSSDADLPADRVVFPGNQGSFTISSTGNETTATINGRETTVGWTGYTTGPPEQMTVVVDGTSYTVFEGEGIQENGHYLRFSLVQISQSDYDLLVYNSDPTITHSSDQYEYRVIHQNTDRYSKPIYFDVSTSDGFNIPYVENVTVDNNLQYDFVTGAVSPQSTVSAVVRQQESDNYNITLEDRSQGTDIETATVESGTVSNIYSEALSTFFGGFTDTAGFTGENLDKVSFNAQGADLLSQEAQTYNYGFTLEDFDGTLTRNTADYTVDTSGTNDAPNITAVEGFTGSTWKPVENFDTYGETFEEIRVTVDDANNDLVAVNVNLTEVYDGTVRESNVGEGYNFDEKNGDQYIYYLNNSQVPTSEINDSGTWRVDVQTDDGGKTDSETRSWSVPWGDLTVKQVAPTNDVTLNLYEEFTWQVKVGCSRGECVNENESLRVWPDPFSLDGIESEVVSSS